MKNKGDSIQTTSVGNSKCVECKLKNGTRREDQKTI